MTKNIIITGGILVLVGFFIFSAKKDKSQIVGSFTHVDTSFSLYKEKNKYDMINISLVNEATSRIHATS